MKPINPILGFSPTRISRVNKIEVEGKAWDSVVFQQGKSLLDFDLNVMQRILREGVAQVSRSLLKSGWIVSDVLTVNGAGTQVTIPDNKVNFLGTLARIADPLGNALANTVSMSAKDSSTLANFLWLELWFQEIIPTGVNLETMDGSSDTTVASLLKTSLVLKYGGVANTGSELENELRDSTFGAETTRRIQVRWRLRVTENVVRATYTKGFNVDNGLSVNASVIAQGGKTATVAGKTFIRSDKLADPDFSVENDNRVYVAGDGTATDAVALNCIDGRVYGLPIAFVWGGSGLVTNLTANIVDLRDKTSSAATTIDSTSVSAGVGTHTNITGSTGGGAIVQAISSDANADLYLTAKGTGTIKPGRLLSSAQGSAQAPSYSWVADSDTGIYNSVAGQIDFSVNATNVGYFSSAKNRFEKSIITGNYIGAGLLGASSLTYGLQIIGGNARIQRTATPTLTSVTSAGGTGTTWEYKIVARDSYGNQTMDSAVVSVNGAATLTTNTNTLLWSLIDGAATYDVLRNDGTAYRYLSSTASNTYVDNGSATPTSYTFATRNTTGDLLVDGRVTASDGLVAGSLTLSGAITGATTINASGVITAASFNVTGSGGSLGAVTASSLNLSGGALTNASAITTTTLTVTGTSTFGSTGQMTISAAGVVNTSGAITGGALTGSSLALGAGGITNTGAIAGATTISASGAITGGALTGSSLALAAGGITSTGAIAGATTIAASGASTFGGIVRAWNATPATTVMEAAAAISGGAATFKVTAAGDITSNSLTTTDLTVTNTITGSISGNASTVTTNANLTGDVVSTGNATTVIKVNGVAFSSLSTGILKNTTTTGAVSIAVAADFPTLNQDTTGLSAKATNIAGGTVGQVPYQSAANTTAFLAGNATISAKFLKSQGDGTNITAPTFASLAAADLPSIPISLLSASTYAIGTTTASLGTTSLGTISGLTAVYATTFTGALSGNASTATSATSATTATNLAGGAIGQVPYQSASGTTVFASGNTTTANWFLRSTGVSGAATAPIFTTLSAADLPTVPISLLSASTYAIGTTTASLGTTSLGTISGLTAVYATTFTGALSGNASTATSASSAGTATTATTATNIASGVVGSVPYQSGSGATVLLSPNTVATQKFLAQTGTGSVGAAPVWASLATADIPSGIQITTLTGTLPVSMGGTAITSLATGDKGKILMANGTANTWVAGSLVGSGSVSIDTTTAGQITISSSASSSFTSGLSITGLTQVAGTTTIVAGTAGSNTASLSLNANTVTLSGAANTTATVNQATISSATINPANGINQTVTSASGIEITPPIAGGAGTGLTTVVSAFGLKVNTVSNAYAYNAYGLYVAAPTSAKQNYGLYVTANSPSYLGGTVTLGAATGIAGSTKISALAAPVISSVARGVGSGSTTYYYKVTAVDAQGKETVGSTSGSIGSQNVTLSGAATNVITWSVVYGAVGYNVYRSLANTWSSVVATDVRVNAATLVTESTTGTGQLSYTDAGGGTTSTLPPTANTTGTLTLDSPLVTSSGGTGVTTTPSNGYLLIGNGSGYTVTGLTAGVGISVANAAGSITINASGVPNTALTNSSITLGSSAVSLGSTLSTITGLTAVYATDFVGKVTNVSGGAVGQVPYQSAANTTAFVSANTTTANWFLRSTGNGTVGSAPVFTTLSTADLPSGIPISLLSASTYAIGTTTGTLGATSLSTISGLTTVYATTFTGALSGNASTATSATSAGTATTATTATNIAGGTVGQVPYQSTSGTTAYASGNSTTANWFLRSTGVSGVATAPIFTTLSAADLPSIPISLLSSSSVTIGTSSVALGASSATLAGVQSYGFTGLSSTPTTVMSASTYKIYIKTTDNSMYIMKPDGTETAVGSGNTTLVSGFAKSFLFGI